jgi:glycosyltransferase involved in cell wall biosynthesis
MCDALYDRFGAVQKQCGKFDIVHGHDWLPMLALTRIKEDYGLAVLLTMHSTEWGRQGNSFGGRFSQEKFNRELLGCNEASLVIVASRPMQEELMSLYSLPRERIRIIPNGIIAGKIRRGVDEAGIKEKYGIDPTAPLVLFCGRMKIQKGPDLLVDAVPLVLKNRSDARFVFVGEGPMRPDCERRACELGVADACRFLGYTPNTDKDELINACDLMCISSRNEPFGIVVLEAWDACKPVVATEAVSIVNNFEDGLVARVEPDSIAGCINRLLADPKEMAKLARAGCSRIETEFSWDHIAEKTEEAYVEALK